MGRDFRGRIKISNTDEQSKDSTVSIAEVDKVEWHQREGDMHYNRSDIIMRDRRMPDDPSTTNYTENMVPSIQDRTLNHAGQPHNPRRGNFVIVLYNKDKRPIIAGTVASKQEIPVCRGTPYDEREKLCQYQPLTQEKNLNFIKAYPEPKKPGLCTTWFHGPCKGDKTDDEQPPCKGRDYQIIYDYCQQGDEEPSCQDCINIDYCQRDDNTWMKVYSSDTMSTEVPPSRYELHQKDGSYLRFENETGMSKEYSEGRGHIRLGNAVAEDLKKGHLNLNPKSSIDLHSVHEEAVLSAEALGTRLTVVAPDDMTVNYAVEAMDFASGSYIRILKNGDIVAHSGTKVTLDAPTVKVTGTSTVTIEAPTVEIKGTTNILLDSPLTEYTGVLQPVS